MVVPVVTICPGHFHRCSARLASGRTSPSSSRSRTRPLALSRGPGRAFSRQHGWTCMLVAFLVLSAGLLKVPLSLNDPCSKALRCRGLQWWRWRQLHWKEVEKDIWAGPHPKRFKKNQDMVSLEASKFAEICRWLLRNQSIPSAVRVATSSGPWALETVCQIWDKPSPGVAECGNAVEDAPAVSWAQEPRLVGGMLLCRWLRQASIGFDWRRMVVVVASSGDD